MLLVYTDEFFDVFSSYEKNLQRKVVEKIKMLINNPGHPSLNTHKMKRTDGKWELYVDMGKRIIYDTTESVISLWKIGSHEIVDRAHTYSFSPHTRFRSWNINPHNDCDVAKAEVKYEFENIANSEEDLTQSNNPFAHFPAAHLRILGVPASLVNEVRKASSIEKITEIKGIPNNSVNWLLELVTNGNLEGILYDAGRLMYRSTIDQLEGYCEGKIKRLMLNLNEEQQRYTDLSVKNNLVIRGCAGSGKTTVGLYRAINKAMIGRRVLVLTYTRTLSAVNKTLIEELIGSVPDNLTIDTINHWMLELLAGHGRPLAIIPDDSLQGRLEKAIEELKDEGRNDSVLSRPIDFFSHEIGRIIKGCMLSNIEDYLEHYRYSGRRPLSRDARRTVWDIYSRYLDILDEHEENDWADIPLQFYKHADDIEDARYDEIIIDEAQDLTAAQIQAARKMLVPEGCLTILTDFAQTIYARGYNWSQAGVSAPGNTYILRKNYRNTNQIVAAATQLALRNQDLIQSGCFVSPEAPQRNGPTPILWQGAPNQEARWVVNKILDFVQDQLFRLSDFAILCPSTDLCKTVIKELSWAELPYLFHKDAEIDILEERVKVMTIHSAKGMEFPVVFLFGINEGTLPQHRLSSITDSEELSEQLERERLILYVGITRAAEVLYLIGTKGKISRFTNEIGAFLRQEPS